MSQKFTPFKTDDDDVRIEDFAAFYPPQDTRYIQEFISNKAEYIKTRARGNWPIDINDLLSPNQSEISVADLKEKIKEYNVIAKSQEFKYEELNLIDENGIITREKLDFALNNFNPIIINRHETISKEGAKKFFNHQASFHIAAQHTDYMAIFDETGSGKTCKMEGASEIFLDLREAFFRGENTRNGNLSQIIFLAQRDTQKNEIKRQLVCVCAKKGKYESVNALNASVSKERSKAITIAIKGKNDDGTTIENFGVFASEIARNYPTTADNARIIRDYGRGLVVLWIDELHQTRIDPRYFGEDVEATQTARMMGTIGPGQVIPIMRLDNVEYFNNLDNVKLKVKNYFNIWRFRQLLPQIKMWGSTATPLVKQPSDIISTMNMVLPLNRQMPGNFYKKERTEEEYRRHFEGCVSFVRASKTGAEENNIGITVGTITIGGKTFDSTTRINPLKMSKFQAAAYPRVREVQSGVFSAEFHASLFVFPDGNYGSGTGDAEGRKRKVPKGLEEEISNIAVNNNFLTNIQAIPTNDTAPLKSFSNIPPISAPSGMPTFNVPLTGAPTGMPTFNVPLAGVPSGMPTFNVPIAGAPSMVPTFGAPIAGTVYNTSQKVIKNGVEVTLAKNGLPAAAGFVVERNHRFYVNDLEQDFRINISRLETLRNYSVKYAEIIEKALSKEGNVFIFNRLIAGSGISMLDVILPYYSYKQMCLNTTNGREEIMTLNFERFMGESSVFQLNINSGKLAPFCSGKHDTSGRIIKPNFGKRPRYAFITGKNSAAETNNILEAFNSPENVNGEYIKIIIVSDVGKEGINIENILQIHMLGGEWNESEIYQALSRCLRVDSHQTILNLIAARNRAAGVTKAPSVTVDIYKHVCIINNPDGSIEPSIDLKVLIRAESIDRVNHVELRKIKQLAFDCQLNYWRNHRRDDVDGSKACDYDKCFYPCSDPWASGPVDYSTYDVYYSDIEIEEIIDKIGVYFLSNNSASINRLQKLFGNRRKMIILALDRMINRNYQIKNIYGFNCYLREDHGNFYLDQIYPAAQISDINQQYYINNIIALKDQNFSDLAMIQEIEQDLELNFKNLIKLLSGNFTQFELDDAMRSLSWATKQKLVEMAIERHVRTGKLSDLDRLIINYYSRLIITTPDQPQTIKALQDGYRDGKKISMKELKKRKIINYRAYELDPNLLEVDQETVIICFINIFESGLTRFAHLTDFYKIKTKLRIFKISEGKWRNCNLFEEIAYNKVAQTVLKRELLGKFELSYKPYLIKLPDQNTIRVRDPIPRRDKRTTKRGRDVKTSLSSGIIDFLYLTGFTGHQKLTEEINYAFRKIQNIISGVERDDGTVLIDIRTLQPGTISAPVEDVKGWLAFDLVKYPTSSQEDLVELQNLIPELVSWRSDKVNNYLMSPDLFSTLTSYHYLPFYTKFIQRVNYHIIFERNFNVSNANYLNTLLIEHLYRTGRYYSFDGDVWIETFLYMAEYESRQ